VNVTRTVPAGIAQLGGGEIVLNQLVRVIYDGSQYQLQNPALKEMPGVVVDYAGAAGCPTGFSEATGGSLAAATYPALNTVLSTTWGSPGGGNFSLPNLNNRATFGRGNGSNLITVAGNNFDGSAVGNVGGQQGQLVGIDKAFLKSFALSVTDPGHAHGPGARATDIWGTSGNVDLTVQSGSGVNVGKNSGTSSVSTGISVNSGGSGTAFPTLSPAAIVLKCVRL
jgi:microcystin-dependent protein